MDNRWNDLRGKYVLLAEDNQEEQTEMVAALEEAGLTVSLCSSGIEMIQTLSSDAALFDVIVTDLYDMGSRGAKFIPLRDIPRLVKLYPLIPFIVYSGADYLAQQYETFGVKGYVLKDDGPQCLLEALYAVVIKRKEMYYSPKVKLEVRLSPQEIRVLRFLRKGLSVKEIASAMGLAQSTVNEFKNRASTKLCPEGEDASTMNTTRVVAIAVEKGLI